jgi:hypothetical protein
MNPDPDPEMGTKNFEHYVEDAVVGSDVVRKPLPICRGESIG